MYIHQFANRDRKYRKGCLLFIAFLYTEIERCISNISNTDEISKKL